MVCPSSAPPAAPAVLAMMRVGLTPAQPLNNAPASRGARKSGRDCMGPFYPAYPPLLRPFERNRITRHRATYSPTFNGARLLRCANSPLRCSTDSRVRLAGNPVGKLYFQEASKQTTNLPQPTSDS